MGIFGDSSNFQSVANQKCTLKKAAFCIFFPTQTLMLLYYNAHGTTSWLDHCVTSVTGLDNIESVTVIDDYVCSDHLPLRVIVICDLATNNHCVSGRNRNDFIDWKTARVHDYDKFDAKSSKYLSNVDVSVSLFNCTDQACKLHEGEIDRLYGDITKSLNMAANISIPRRKSGTRQQTAGWNEIVKESHEVARSDFKLWCSQANHSTEMCIYALHEFIYYYRSRSTNVYVTFLDTSKALDRINYWLLFDKLLKREMPCYIVRILVYWYRTQTMYVQWASCESSLLKVTNCVRQGRILSPTLFIVSRPAEAGTETNTI